MPSRDQQFGNEMMAQERSTQSATPSCFDLGQLAANGLKRGYTTGSCATSAVKAALLRLVCYESPSEVNITLPDGAQYLTIPIDCIRDEDDGTVRADVIKDAGDDPDQTHRARIFARVKRNGTGEIVFLRGEGVGVVTQPGMQIAIGSPAINPIPRRMMIQAVQEVLDEEMAANTGLDGRSAAKTAGKLPGAPSIRASGFKAASRFSGPPESWNRNRWQHFKHRSKFTSAWHSVEIRTKSCSLRATSASDSRATRSACP
jgi:hypothetical protein